MKKLMLFLLVFSTEFASAKCANKIDPSKVMLFIDTNNSELEIATTEKAACARGEKLVIVPKNYKEYDKHIVAVHIAGNKVDKLKCTYYNTTPACKKSQEELTKTYNNLQTFKKAQKLISESVKEALEEIKKSKAKLTNLSISGHDGGGLYAGAKGMYGRSMLAADMKDMGEINEVKSLMLLGCYTGTPKEVFEWLTIFPQTKLIGGYDGSGPLSDRPLGHEYISDILTKEKQLTAYADQKKLQAYVSANIKGLANLNAALFLQCNDGSTTHSYYYGSKRSKKIEKLDIKECISKKKELQDLAVLINQYNSGEIEPPTDTQNGALRAIYNKARSLEHCAQITGVPVSINAAFNLLFYDGVKNSFAHQYKDELKEAEGILENISLEEMEKSFRTNQSMMERLISKVRKPKLKNEEVAFLEFKEFQKDPKNKIWVPNAENLKKYSRKELMENTHRINKVMSLGVLSKKQNAAMSWLKAIQQNHLQAFQNPFSWHEFNGHNTEAPPYTPKLKNYLSGDTYNRGNYSGGFGGGGDGFGGGGGLAR